MVAVAPAADDPVRDLLVITPTRGRLASAIRLADAVRRTRRASTHIVFGIDLDDTAMDGDLTAMLPDCGMHAGPRQTCAAWTNEIAAAYPGYSYYASLSDDHLPETDGWDVRLIEAIEASGGPGIAYGDDTLQGKNLPTAPVMSGDIVRELGWMFMPAVTRLFADNAWLDLGTEAGCLTYVPDVTIRHLHYTAGLAPRDQTAIDGEGAWGHDEAAYHEWKRERMAGDVAKVRALREAPCRT